MLAVIETHPVQYHAPVYRSLQERFGIPVTAIYGSDFSVSGYEDREFGTTFAWDTDLLSGYTPVFLSHVASGGASNVSKVRVHGLFRTLKRSNPKAVLAVGYSPFFHQAAIVSALILRKPLLFRGETADLPGDRNSAKSFVRSFGLRLLYSKISAFLYLGERSRDHYERHGCLPSRMFFSPYCVDTNSYHHAVSSIDPSERASGRQSLGIGTDKIVILFCGKFYPAKGPGVLLEAMRILPASYLGQIELLFVGHGEMRDELEQVAKEIPGLRSHFVGFQNQSQLGKFYRLADMLVLPSFTETWGMVINEALQYGLPCVVTDHVGCGPDLVRAGVTGELCEARSAPSLASAITRALALVRNQRVSMNCRALVARYSVGAAAEGIFQAYRFVTSGN